MRKDDTNYTYKLLAEAMEAGKCCFFLGAGVASATAGKLTTHLVKTLENYKLRAKNRWGLSGVAQYFEMMLGPDRLREKVQDFVERNAISSEIHELLAKLPAMTTIFTTNYDNMLEQQFDAILRPYVLIVTQEDLTKWDEKKTVIVKLHGSFEKGRSSLVITDDDYVSFLMNSNLLKDTFKHSLCTKTAILIGYSLLDYNIKLLLEEVKSVFGKDKILGYLIQKERIIPEQNHYWRTKGIKILQEDGARFLRNLEKELSGGSKNVNLSYSD